MQYPLSYNLIIEQNYPSMLFMFLSWDGMVLWENGPVPYMRIRRISLLLSGRNDSNAPLKPLYVFFAKGNLFKGVEGIKKRGFKNFLSIYMMGIAYRNHPTWFSAITVQICSSMTCLLL